jgi:hypothetical protein
MRRNWLPKACPQPRVESCLQQFLENAGWIDGTVMMKIQFGEPYKSVAPHRGLAAKRPRRFCVNWHSWRSMLWPSRVSTRRV